MKYHDSGNGWTFVSASAWENSVNVTKVGVGMNPIILPPAMDK